MIQSKMESVYSSLNSPKVAASEHAGGFSYEKIFWIKKIMDKYERMFYTANNL